MRTPCGDEFRYQYDRANRLNIIESEFGERSFGYDSLDHIVSDTDALGNSYTAEFDLMGNLRRECSPKENASEEQSRYWRYAYDGMDNPIHTESPLGIVYAKEYDGESRLTKEIHPEAENGEGIAYDYDADGYKIRIHYPDGGIERLFYDAEGNLIKEVKPNQYDKATDDGAGTTYTYDAGNRRTSVTSDTGVLLEVYRYDAKGRCVYHQDTGQLEASREGMAYATTYRYDLVGNKLEERKAVSEKDGAIQYSLRRWTYDIHNNITEEKTWLTLQSETSASGLTRTICNNYDKQNRLILCYGYCKCLGRICRPRTPKVWIYTDEKSLIGGAPKLTQDSRLFCMNGGVIDTSSGILGIMGSAALLFCSDFTLGISAIAGAYGLKKSLRGVLA